MHMMNRKSLFVMLLLVSSIVARAACSDNNYTIGPFVYHAYGFSGHINPDPINSSHGWVSQFLGGAYYTGTGISQPCFMHATIGVQAVGADSGKLTPWYILDHEIRTNTKGGDAYSNGASITVDGEAAAAVEQCTIPGCGATPSISGSGNGFGFSVSMPPGNIYSDTKYVKVAAVGPVYSGSCLSATTRLVNNPLQQCSGHSPIVAAHRHGTKLVDAFSDPKKACVMFDLESNGKPKCYSFPLKDSGVGFLVYDPDKNGVHDSTSLFGNFSPHADFGMEKRNVPVGKNRDSQGYRRLMWLDQPEQGGNQDFEISGDELKDFYIWTPDHCWDNREQPCESIPSELHPVQEYDIHSLSYIYQASMLTDKNGNAFKFCAQINPHKQRPQEPEDKAKERLSCDVFLALGN